MSHVAYSYCCLLRRIWEDKQYGIKLFIKAKSISKTANNMTKINILSKILGSRYFEQLMVDEKAINQTLNAHDLMVGFEPNTKYFEIKKNVEDEVLRTIEQLQEPISSSEVLQRINHSLIYEDENQDDKIGYLYKFHFNAIYATLLKQVELANNFLNQETKYLAALELYDNKRKEYDCRDHWLTKFLPLFEETNDEESQLRYDYDKDKRLYSVTKLKIFVTEDLVVYRQKFKGKYVQLSKELSKKYKNYYIEGRGYFDDY